MAGARLLLVDDDPELGLIVRVLCRRAGHEVERRGDVESAWAALRDRAPDLVLLDVNLPGHSGLELLRRVRAEGTLSGQPVALFCHAGLTPTVAAAWAAGADYLVPKDLVTDADGWSSRIGEILEYARGRAQLPSLGCVTDSGSPTSPSWGEALNRALDLAPMRALGAEVAEQALRRALTRALGRVPPGWLSEGTGRFDPAMTPGLADAVMMERALSRVVEEVWRLLGRRATQAFADRLREGLTGPP